MKSLGSSGGGGGSAGNASAFGQDDPIKSAVRGGSAGAGVGAQANSGTAGAGGGGGGTVTSFAREDVPKAPRIPDLRKFLPSGQSAPADDSRGGLHGPHTDLFRQVNQRYKQKSQELLTP